MDLVSQISAWLSYIFDANIELQINDENEDVIFIYFIVNGTKCKPTNVGFGYSYVLPILVAGLTASNKHTLIIENPEAHLHPKAQARLTEFLARVASCDVQIFIESHSEHILNALQVAVALMTLQSANRNLTPPPAPMLPAWNLQGQFGLFNATPIGPEHFVAAKHIGGATGLTFTYSGVNYITSSFTDVAGTDLRVWKIDTLSGTRTFPTWAPVWNPSVDGSEVNKPLVVFGRGTQRGEAVYAPIFPGPIFTPPRPPTVLTAGPETTPGGPPLPGPAPTGQGDLRGWKWGAADAQASWGQNKVEFALTDPDFGQLLGFNFDSGSLAGPNEAILSAGDSSGGVFVQSTSGQWKLVGVNLSVDGAWSFASAGPYFNGAIFDARGLYVGSSANNQLLPYATSPLTASSYSTRVSGYLNQLSTITNNFGAGGGTLLPEPMTATTILLAGLSLGFLRRR